MRESRTEHSGVMEVQFYVPQELVGLAIGKEGSNVNEARRLDGIHSIEFDDYSSMFRVRGEVRVIVSIVAVVNSPTVQRCHCQGQTASGVHKRHYAHSTEPRRCVCV